MEKIIIEIIMNTSVKKAWEYYTESGHITQWNFADDSWHCPRAETDLRVGGRFVSRMEARDGSGGFDFEGTYDEVIPKEKIVYSFGDRKAEITFAPIGAGTKITVSFDPETENPIEMQRAGWQAILENYKKHVEGH
jgi:uncharacterized protein YndB with AHSA1/START domain